MLILTCFRQTHSRTNVKERQLKQFDIFDASLNGIIITDKKKKQKHKNTKNITFETIVNCQ